MAAETLFLLVAALLAVPLCWLLPTRLRDDGISIYTILVIAILSFPTAVWLVVSSTLTIFTLSRSARSPRPNALYAGAAVILVAGLLIPRDLEQWQLVGAAYFTLRNLHVLLDGWMGRNIITPSLRQMMHYQFFLPLVAVGPIHRMPTFLRSLRMRRLHGASLAAGAERALLGLAMASILGAGLMGSVEYRAAAALTEAPLFIRDWAGSALDWVQLYFVFAGLSSFAIGLSLMMGIKIEENFNRPLQSRDLLDFWTRWHMSLSLWCRDYVFQPVTAATRRPFLGLAAAMLAIGLWHETSAYYVMWSAWQILGIALNRLLISSMISRGLALPGFAAKILSPFAILAWLSIAKPVIGLIEGLFA
jgi:alginate O-acetyltransferase complex protein AlgI